MSIKDRGFASMDPEKQREIASIGGKAAHEKGTAHEFTSQEAREAGRKGGKASQNVEFDAENEMPSTSHAFEAAIANQEELVIRVQKLLKQELENGANSEKVEELSSALEDLTEGLNNLIDYCEFKG